jgi:hypothetical protein
MIIYYSIDPSGLFGSGNSIFGNTPQGGNNPSAGNTSSSLFG